MDDCENGQRRGRLTPAIGIVSVDHELLELDGLSDSLVSLRQDTLVSKAQDTAHVGKGVLLQAHGEAIGVGEHFLHNLGNGLAREAILVFVDEEGVFREATSVEEERDALAPRKSGGFSNVGHGYRLASGPVVGDCHEDHGGVVMFVKEVGRRRNVKVALEWILLANQLGREGVVEARLGEGLQLEPGLGGIDTGRIKEAVADDAHFSRALGCRLLGHRAKQQGFGTATLGHNEEVGAF